MRNNRGNEMQQRKEGGRNAVKKGGREKWSKERGKGGIQ